MPKLAKKDLFCHIRPRAPDEQILQIHHVGAVEVPVLLEWSPVNLWFASSPGAARLHTEPVDDGTERDPPFVVKGLRLLAPQGKSCDLCHVLGAVPVPPELPGSGKTYL